ncbi:MAG: LysR family transcriptional regulator [Lachnospiraceae bacterium]
MNTKELEYFCVVCREKSITKAAKLLYMSPQGLSKIIKNLENELEATLLIRSKAGVELTESGKCLYNKAGYIVEHCKEVRNDIRIIEKSYAGEIDLLSAYGILRLISPDCIVKFKQNYPQIGLTYREYPDLEVERRFLEKEGNIAFSLAPFAAGIYDVKELKSYKIKLLVYKEHPLSSRDSVTIHDLKGEPLYIESSEFKIYHLIVNRCLQAGFEPNIIFETSGFSLCHRMCREKKGISVTVDFISNDMTTDDLRLIPFSDENYEWKACMLIRQQEQPSREVMLFQNYVQNWIKDI